MTKKIIPKPIYWTDFEDLCQKLWAEIWQYPETKKHGRNGQPQSGVDIYGRSEKGYIGIQCKGKDDYSHQQLTIKEIDSEIAKAEQFTPPLTKFYFATTSNRSTIIDAHVRKCDEKQRQNGGFEVHVFFWEDIADRIEENRTTYNWYINGHNFRQQFDAKVLFDDNSEINLQRPHYIKRIKSYLNVDILKILDFKDLTKDLNIYKSPLMPKIKLETFEEYVAFLNEDHYVEQSEDPQPIEYFLNNMVHEAKRTNLSVSVIQLKLLNSGDMALEDFKIYLEFVNVLSCDTVTKRKKFLDLNKYTYNLFFSEENPFTAEFAPRESVLVENDSILLDKICVRTSPEDTDVLINWKLLSRGYQRSGQLTVQIKPIIEVYEDVKWVEHPDNFTPQILFTDKHQY